jgi:ribonuclease P protein component
LTPAIISGFSIEGSAFTALPLSSIKQKQRWREAEYESQRGRSIKERPCITVTLMSQYLHAALSHNEAMPEPSSDWRSARLRRHADYQRVYQGSRKQFSSSMSYFFRFRSAEELTASAGPRVGLTAGRVLGKAVERNRIKRRMREAVRLHLALLPRGVDVVLHPRKSVLDLEFARLEHEVSRIFTLVAKAVPPEASSSSRAGAQP